MKHRLRFDWEKSYQPRLGISTNAKGGWFIVIDLWRWWFAIGVEIP